MASLSNVFVHHSYGHVFSLISGGLEIPSAMWHVLLLHGLGDKSIIKCIQHNVLSVFNRPSVLKHVYNIHAVTPSIVFIDFSNYSVVLKLPVRDLKIVTVFYKVNIFYFTL